MASSFFFLILIFPSLVLSSNLFYTTLPLPSPGPESFAFDRNGEGPYTSISDGRIVKYKGPKLGFVDFGYCNPYRLGAICDGINGTDNGIWGRVCGRPLGLSYCYKTGEIYVADAYYGMCVIGPKGGLGKILAKGVDRKRFHVPDGIDVDQSTGDVYMTDASSVYTLDQSALIAETGDSTGSVVKYDNTTKKVTTLMTGVAGVAGVAISNDSSYILVSENPRDRLLRYWLTGPKAKTSEIFLNMVGRPNKLVRTSSGDFWVGVTIFTETPHRLIAQRVNGDGIILESVTVSPTFDSSLLTEAHPNDGVLYLGSMYSDVVGVYQSRRRQYVASE